LQICEEMLILYTYL